MLPVDGSCQGNRDLKGTWAGEGGPQRKDLKFNVTVQRSDGN